MIHVIWEFRVKEKNQKQFELYYSANGKWAELFRRSPSYRETILTRDKQDRSRYVLTDVWDDLDSYQAFKKRHAQDYNALDKRCEEFTVVERCLGIFEVL